MSKEREALQKIVDLPNPKNGLSLSMQLNTIKGIAPEALQSESEESYSKEEVEQRMKEAFEAGVQFCKDEFQPKSESEWISVEDRLPESRQAEGWSHSKDVNILILKYGEYIITTGAYSHYKKEWSEHLYNNNFNQYIIGWMPLPQAPSIKTPKI